MTQPSSSHEFLPLLPPGLHVLTLDDLRALCVSPFPNSRTRPNLVDNLEQVHKFLTDAGANGEMWLDGSLLTEKLDPNDSDAVLRLQADSYDSGTDAVRSAVDGFAGGLKATHGCDSYVFFQYPEGHPQFWYGEYMYSYWLRQWGFSRGDNLKGIAVLRVNGGIQ